MAAISNLHKQLFRILSIIFLETLFVSANIQAAVLPEDRSDIMGHYYDGGEIQISGPAVLIRKGIADKASFALTHYVDSISSASIDVVTTASPYSEERNETGLGMDYLYQDTLMNLNYSVSKESDYDANTYGLGLAQEFFGGMTTLNMGYLRGSDTVGKSNDSSFRKDVKRDQYSIGMAQILTKHLLFSSSYEFISDIGFLNNPYRVVRIDRIGDRQNIEQTAEVYPNTRRSHAVSFGLMKYIESKHNSAVRVNTRYFWDTWGISASNVEFGFSHYFGSRRWLMDYFVRVYSQSKADFYQDFFSSPLTYMARDKELSTFDSQSTGAQVSYHFLRDKWKFLDKGSVNLAVEFMKFDYENFSDLRVNEGTYLEPYEFDAQVYEFFISLWY